MQFVLAASVQDHTGISKWFGCMWCPKVMPLCDSQLCKSSDALDADDVGHIHLAALAGRMIAFPNPCLPLLIAIPAKGGANRL